MSLTKSWEFIVATYSPAWIEFLGFQVVQVLAFWLPCTIYITLHKIAPGFSQRHKIQPAPKQATTEEIRHCISVVLRNQALNTCTQALMIWASWYMGMPHQVTARVPSIQEVLRDLMVCMLLREIGFYYSHRTLHQRKLYSRFHKQHHRFTAPMAFAAQYAHPVEHFFANMLPVGLPPVIMGSHILVAWLFTAIELLETSTVHSGYDFFAGLARAHDLHHEKFMLNFGGIGLLDWVHGTNKLKKRE